jgi:hypothetical protein
VPLSSEDLDPVEPLPRSAIAKPVVEAALMRGAKIFVNCNVTINQM